MKTEDFDFLAGMLKERSGLMLTPDKVYLLESRLTPLARKRGLDTLDALVQKLRMRSDQALIRDVTEAMTTNESFFFRDNTPFDLFKNLCLLLFCQLARTGGLVVTGRSFDPRRTNEFLVELLHAANEVGDAFAHRSPHLVKHPHALAFVFDLRIELGVA